MKDIKCIKKEKVMLHKLINDDHDCVVYKLRSNCPYLLDFFISATLCVVCVCVCARTRACVCVHVNKEETGSTI